MEPHILCDLFPILGEVCCLQMIIGTPHQIITWNKGTSCFFVLTGLQTVNNLNQLKYSAINAKFKVNNFLTSFKYIEENDNIGDQHYLTNRTSYNFDENNSIVFLTRKNKKIDITEYYNLLYQYQNDCLTAALKYSKDYYVDNDLKPEEQLYFSLTIVPLGAWESKNIIHQLTILS